MIRKIVKKSRSAYRLIRGRGPVSFSTRVKDIIRSKKPIFKQKLYSLVKQEDVLKADWTDLDNTRFYPQLVKKDSYSVNWVMSPPGKGSGGHQNIFRFIRYLEQAGHKNKIYLYSTEDYKSISEVRKVLRTSYSKIDASIEWLKKDMAPADAVFATGWETAYPVFNSTLTAKRLYFVQDFEPYFYPVGSESILAENSYKFGFHGITAGGWLAHKLKTEYGMKTDNYDFGADNSIYKLENTGKRNGVFFYARPVTARRGFELGIMALSQFHKMHPDYEINMAGWDVSNYDIPFPYNNLCSLSLSDLSPLYNKCAVGLVISLTNMSLLPLELLACGTIPVVNDGPNNRLVSNNSFIAYSENNPHALAKKMSEIVTRKDLPEYAKQAVDQVAGSSWDQSGAAFVKIVERVLRNG